MTGDWRDALRGLDLPPGSEEENIGAPAEQPRKLPRIIVDFERKGRGGKQATILSGFDCDDDELQRIASELKRRLACGGSARGGEILVQGDRRTQVRQLLRDMGYTTN